MPSEHTVKSFDDDLADIYRLVVEMGRRARRQLKDVSTCVLQGRKDMAADIVAADAELDRLHAEVKTAEHHLLARRQPMAKDLREIVSCGRAATDFERIGDHAKNIARRRIIIGEEQLPESALSGLRGLFDVVVPAVSEVVKALETRDAVLAREIWMSDRDLDHVCNELFTFALGLMQESPRLVPACVHLLFIARSLERCGDHATNVAENVVYWVTGELITEQRPQEAMPE